MAIMKWVTNVSLLGIVTSALLAAACSGNSTPPPEPSTNPSEKVSTEQASAPTERPKMTPDECNAKGTVVYDMGDGKTHAPSYRCADGKPPIGTVPGGREGAVCCSK
ncbi:hypothetical protein LZC95_25845 [Pendulispora brunnea]|uniref:Uncharacterized protein n=1 Tax=Pendulispora brunnea TaxID=2905690 RepID=A0ABZ2JYR3_9BACT